MSSRNSRSARVGGSSARAVSHLGSWKVSYTSACQGLIKKEGKQRFGSQYSNWQHRPAKFEISGHAPVRWAPYTNSHATKLQRPAQNRSLHVTSPFYLSAACEVHGDAFYRELWYRGSLAWQHILASPAHSLLVVAHNAVNQVQALPREAAKKHLTNVVLMLALH